MNDPIATADRVTHLKIVAVALLWGDFGHQLRHRI